MKYVNFLTVYNIVNKCKSDSTAMLCDSILKVMISKLFLRNCISGNFSYGLNNYQMQLVSTKSNRKTFWFQEMNNLMKIGQRNNVLINNPHTYTCTHIHIQSGNVLTLLE